MPFTDDLLPLLQESGAQGNPLAQFLPFILIIGIFWLLILRPQSKERKAQEAMRSELKKGDKVLTQGGIIGKISQVKENQVVVEVDGAKMTLVRNAIVERLEGGAAAADAKS